VSGRVIHVEIIETETLDQLNQSAKSNKLLFLKKLQMNDDPILATLLKVLYLKSSYQLRLSKLTKLLEIVL
jgi:hypothetical protein